MKSPQTTMIMVLPIVMAMSAAARAQLTWRVSVKVVLDEDGYRFSEVCVDGTNDGNACDPDVQCPGGACVDWVCIGGASHGNGCDIDAQCPGQHGECIGDLNTDAEIIAKIDTADAILANHGPPDVPGTEERGYSFDLLEIIDLSGLPAPPANIKACSNQESQFCTSDADCRACVGGTSAGEPCTSDDHCDGGTCSGTATCAHVEHWFHAPIIYDVRRAIYEAAIANPTLWAWNDSAINVYILGSDGSGTGGEMVLMGQDLSSPNTPFHEIGHLFSLEHTHGGGGVSPNCVDGFDDGVADTLEDNCGENCDGGCWSRDEIANWNFPTQCAGGPCLYIDLSSQNQHRVDQVFYNLMCYRGRRDVLTPGQLDRMTDYSNGTVHYATDGRTRFVDVVPGGIVQLGTSTHPMISVSGGLAIADPGDIVLVRTGAYEETLTIDQNVTLRASRGDALIGGLP